MQYSQNFVTLARCLQENWSAKNGGIYINKVAAVPSKSTPTAYTDKENAIHVIIL